MPPTASPIPASGWTPPAAWRASSPTARDRVPRATTRCARRFGPSRRQATASSSTTTSACPNEPVWLHAFVAHAARYGLRYLADADLRTMNAAGVDAEGRALLATLDPVTREQYLDFVRLRRFRQSLLCRADAPIRALDPHRLRAMHASADPSLVRAAEAGKVADLARGLDPAGAGGGPVRALLDALLAAWPASIAVPALPVDGALPAPLESILIRAFVASIVVLHMRPPAVVAVAGERPRASALARHEAATQPHVTSQLHTRVQIAGR